MWELGGFGLSVERRVSRGESVGGSRSPAGWGADGEGAIAAEGLGGNPHEGASADGGEGDAALGDAEEGVEAGGAAGFGWGMHGNTLQFEVSHWGGGVLRVSGP